MFPNNLSNLIILLCSLLGSVICSKSLIHLREESWRDLLKNEWMVEFYAPWCPACKDLSKAWSAFADWSKDLEINVAAVDVTTNPGLSGRFLVTALPTIYHVKDGVFRQYSGPRDKEDFIAFIEEKKWTVVDKIASWKNPDSTQMAIVAQFFKLSMSVRDAHNYLIETKGLPPYASYAIFGAATLLLGCILGFIIVCIIDCFFPTGALAKSDPKSVKKDKKKKEKTSDNEDSDNDDKTKGENNDLKKRGKDKSSNGSAAMSNGNSKKK